MRVLERMEMILLAKLAVIAEGFEAEHSNVEGLALMSEWAFASANLKVLQERLGETS